MNPSKPSDIAAPTNGYRFGLRWLLVVVVVLAVAFSWSGREYLRVTRRTREIRNLAHLDIRVREQEPTGIGLLAKKFLGQKENRLRRKMNENWFSRPAVLVSWTITDEQVPEIVKRIDALGGVRELHVETSPMTEQGLFVLKNKLPKVVVLTRADLVHRQGPRDQFAFAALKYAATVTTGVVAILVVLLWPFRRRRKVHARP